MNIEQGISNDEIKARTGAVIARHEAIYAMTWMMPVILKIFFSTQSTQRNIVIGTLLLVTQIASFLAMTFNFEILVVYAPKPHFNIQNSLFNACAEASA